jgi:hypothetical protein
VTNLLTICVSALLLVESGGRANVPAGDGGRAVGPWQMWPCAVAEANRLIGYPRWTLADRSDKQQAADMCRVTLAWHYRRGVRDAVELCCRWRNPQGNAPQWYRDRVTSALATARKGEA